MKVRIFFLALILGLSLVATATARQVDIDVIALFKGRAMLEINGERMLLAEGERSDEGVLLVSANSREAVVDVGGQEIALDLSSRINAEYAVADSVTVTIGLNDLDQYRTTGSINGRPTSFVVDTGANIVAMNASRCQAVRNRFPGRAGRRQRRLPVARFGVERDALESRGGRDPR
ncbi:MAG: hypothetical protein U5O39_02350 [Gammaproteobacteria bacterium]|nr:hypothetical protein [Gammaproteobacteria bacterium]